MRRAFLAVVLILVGACTQTETIGVCFQDDLSYVYAPQGTRFITPSGTRYVAENTVMLMDANVWMRLQARLIMMGQRAQEFYNELEEMRKRQQLDTIPDTRTF